MTLQWVGSIDTSREHHWGFFTGVGSSNFNYIDTGSETEVNKDGVAGTIGAYWDWGGMIFGGRIGTFYHQTEYEEVEIDGRSYDLSSSMFGTKVDIRWTF